MARRVQKKIKVCQHDVTTVSMKVGQRKTWPGGMHGVSEHNFHKTQPEPSQISTVQELLEIFFKNCLVQLVSAF